MNSVNSAGKMFGRSCLSKNESTITIYESFERFNYLNWLHSTLSEFYASASRFG